jgi:hypothetical protein
MTKRLGPLVLLFGAIAILSACIARPYALECVRDRGLTTAECDAVAGFIVDRQPANQLGDLVTVAVELLECTPELGRMHFESILGDPNVERCWLISLSYEGGDLQRIAYREIAGAIKVL